MTQQALTAMLPHFDPKHTELDSLNGTQKRALSYAGTIHRLFSQVLTSKQPADRVLGQYFRENKKHGSKDRRVIRETLFGIFRWWGWGQQLVSKELQAEANIWYSLLSSTALLEQHPWQDIRSAWQAFAELDSQLIHESEQLLTLGSSVTHKLKAFSCLTGLNALKLDDLLPVWFWQHCKLDEAAKLPLIEAMSSRPPLWLRVQKHSRTAVIAELANDEIAAEASEYFSDALSLGYQSINLNEVSLYKQGHLEVQDLGSQVIGQICQPKADENWWDTCSGAGGKTLQLRSLMYQQANRSNGEQCNNGESGSITSSDIRSHALEELKKRAARAGFDGISIAKWQNDALPVEENTFDGVLVDAPCSCTGTWRRNPDMRWLDTASAIEDKPALQLDILTRSSKAVKAGGQLVYATCSLADAENQTVVNDFLANNSEFELLEIAHPFNGKTSQMLTVWPQEANSDGMFVAKMIKR
jgi:16S rRNA (cytosine967-C5)-methyltransferase